VDKFPSRERAAAATLETRVSAVVVVGAVGSPSLPALDLCIRSVLVEPLIDDVVIVDQGAPHSLAPTLRSLHADRRDVKLVRAGRGASLAAAANLGAEHARGRWLLFIDPDVVLQRGSVQRMTSAGSAAPGPWIVGGSLTDLDGRERRAARAGALNAFSALAIAANWPTPRKRRNAGRSASAARVSAVSGAFMLIPRRDFQVLGGFDEGFATDGADLDLCRRAADAGGSVLYQPAAAGVQFERPSAPGRKQAQGLARFAAKSARTPLERAFAAVAAPALSTVLALKLLIGGRPPLRRRSERR